MPTDRGCPCALEMTLYDYMYTKLIEHGMPKKHANEVMYRVLKKDHIDERKWMKPARDYHESLLVVFWSQVKREALQFIEEQSSNVWYKRAFLCEDLEEAKSSMGFR